MIAPPDEDSLGALIGDIYDAALEPALWVNVLGQIARATNSMSSNVFSVEAVGGWRGFAASSGVEIEHMRSAMLKYGASAPWVQAVFSRPLQSALVMSAVVPTARLMRTDFYVDVLRPFKAIDGMFFAMRSEATRVTGFSTVSETPIGPGEENGPKLIQAIGPHIYRSILLMERVAALEEEERTTRSALDLLGDGVFLVDRFGAIVFANEAARHLYEDADGLSFIRGELHAAVASEDAILRDLIVGCALHPIAGGGGTRISRPSMGEPYHALVLPVPPSATWPGVERAVVVVVVSDPEKPPPIQAALLASLFGLTPAEARVAIAVARGDGVPVIAHAMSLAPNTIRTHLRRIFAKVGVQSQSQLTARLLRVSHFSAEQRPD